MANRMRDRKREARWRALVTQQRKSGVSVRAFCAREHVTESAFYAWRREIEMRDREGVKGRRLCSADFPVCLCDEARNYQL